MKNAENTVSKTYSDDLSDGLYPPLFNDKQDNTANNVFKIIKKTAYSGDQQIATKYSYSDDHVIVIVKCPKMAYYSGVYVPLFNLILKGFFLSHFSET